MNYFWLTILIAALLTVGGFTIAVLIIYGSRRKGTGTDYWNLYLLGIIFTPLGIALVITYAFLLGSKFIIAGIPILALGIIYLITGVMNRNRWKKG